MVKKWKGMLGRGLFCSMLAVPMAFAPYCAAYAEEGNDGVLISEKKDSEVKPGFFYKDGKLFYADGSGNVRTKSGWFLVAGDWYFSDEGGAIRRNTGIWSGGKLYYAGDDGALTGGIYEVNGYLRYFDESGEVVKKEGWLLYNKKWYYVNSNGILKTSEVIPDGGELYYAGTDGALQEAVASYDGKLYYFNQYGKARKVTGWVKYDGDWYFVTAGGALATDRIVGPSNNLYYVGADGKTAGGAHQIDGVYYFFEADGALTKKAGWKLFDGEWYYANPDGKLRVDTGVWSGNTVYYVGTDGKLTGGIHLVSGRMRYFDADGKINKYNGWLAYDGKWYYVDANGIAYSNGSYLIDGKYYYFNADAVMQTGVIQASEGIMYYANKNGSLVTDSDVTIEGVKYHAGAKGEINAGSMYKKAQGYSSDTNYLILVNLSTQRTAVFKGSKNNWLLQREFDCSTGKDPNITPTGEYKTTVHDLYFDSYGWRCWYATGFIGGLYLFHSSPYLKADSPVKVADSTMGKPSSHGCIRLRVEDAKWMYDTLPLRTKVVIFK